MAFKKAVKKKPNERPVRVASQDQQEQRSPGQVQDCFTGWSINPVMRDASEPLHRQMDAV
jgi:hypothetical protein